MRVVNWTDQIQQVCLVEVYWTWIWWTYFHFFTFSWPSFSTLFTLSSVRTLLIQDPWSSEVFWFQNFIQLDIIKLNFIFFLFLLRAKRIIVLIDLLFSEGSWRWAFLWLFGLFATIFYFSEVSFLQLKPFLSKFFKLFFLFLILLILLSILWLPL